MNDWAVKLFSITTYICAKACVYVPQFLPIILMYLSNYLDKIINEKVAVVFQTETKERKIKSFQ